MGKHARSDAYKKARGTDRTAYMEAARSKRAVDNVVAFPQLKEIPPPEVPLAAGGHGEKTYQFWCNALLKVGLLTKLSVGFVENLALADDKIHSRVAAGKEVPDKALEMRRSGLLKLEALNVDSALVPNQEKKNRFARNGFPARLKSPADHNG